MRPTGTCRSCAAPIVWVITDKGKRMPLDPEPSTRGNVWITKTGRVPEVLVASSPQGVPQGEAAYLSHFSTCPDGPSWRRKR